MNALSKPAHVSASRMRQGFPVMSGALPGLGHALRIHRDVVGALREARASLGPVFWVNLGFGQWYLFLCTQSSFELLRHPKVGNAGARASLDFILGRSLLASDGVEHRRVRMAMNPIFSPKGLAESGSGMRIAEVVQARAARWASQDQVAVHEEMKEMALDVIFRITGVGDQDLPTWRRQYGELLLGLLPIPWDLPLSPRRRALRAAAWVNAAITTMVEQARREDTGGDSITAALARARDEAGQPLSTRDLVDNIRLLFLAGHETTATTTAWAVLELAQRHDLWDRLVSEAQRGPGVPTTMAEAKAFPFAEAIFRESVRLYGPAWFLERQTTDAIDLEGAHIPAGTRIGLPPAVWSRDADLFPNPDTFDPDRWVGRAGPTPLELAQFGGGAHFCLGYHLAWLEVVAFLVALGRAVERTERRPQLLSREKLEPRYLPMPHPPSRARVRFA